MTTGLFVAASKEQKKGGRARRNRSIQAGSGVQLTSALSVRWDLVEQSSRAWTRLERERSGGRRERVGGVEA